MPGRRHLVAFLALTFALMADDAGAQGLTTRAADPADVSTIDGIVAAFYDIVSHDAGEPIDWARDSTLYLADLRFRIADATPAGMRVRSLDHAAFAAAFSDVRQAFHEREIHRVTQRFGPIAHVWSTYEWRTAPDGPVGGRGINSIDLYFDGTRWWIGSASWASETHDQPIPAEFLPPVVPVFADTAAMRNGAQAIIDAFAAGIARAHSAELGAVPSAEVRNTPQLIFFAGRSNTIVAPWWDTQPDEMRAVFRVFAGGDDADAEYFFRAFFNRFLIAHEAAHWFQARASRREATLYENENMANRLAVAFWRTQPGGEALLAELERLATAAAARLPDPTPRGEDPVEYFGAHYQELGADPLKYGYYQFRFMADALRDRAGLDFAEMVR